MTVYGHQVIPKLNQVIVDEERSTYETSTEFFVYTVLHHQILGSVLIYLAKTLDTKGKKKLEKIQSATLTTPLYPSLLEPYLGKDCKNMESS